MEEDRLGYIRDRIDRIHEVLDELQEQAEADAVVSDDEKNILENVKENIANYKRLARELMKGGEISDKDLEKLYIFEKQIVQSASSEALADGYITNEEGDLLQHLLDFFEKFNDDED